MQAALAHAAVMQSAIAHGIIGVMAEKKRRQDEIARQNLQWLIQACSQAQGSSRGGLRLLADLTGTSYNYLSAVANAYADRTIGKEVKTRIESALKLSDGWMDTEHGHDIVGTLVRQIPSRPRQQRISTPRKGADTLTPDEVRELRESLDVLRSLLERVQNNRR